MKKCIDCDRPVEGLYQRCKKHRKQHFKKIKELHERYRREGRCVSCGNTLNPGVDGGYRKCQKCRNSG